MKILDCTFRDGGYYTNWDFTPETVQAYLNQLNRLPVDIIEIGYRNKPAGKYFGAYYYCPDYLMEQIRKQSDHQLAILLDQKNVQLRDLPELIDPCKPYIDLVRIALDPAALPEALKLAEYIRKAGMEVALNIMYMSKWKKMPGLIQELKQAEGLVNYIYMVDSYGAVYPNEVRDLAQLLRDSVSVPLGFHGHNNMELALANTLAAMDAGVEMVDATVMGMGRGAGNLKTELLLASLHTRDQVSCNLDALSSLVTAFEPLHQKHQWGTNLPYMISGGHSLPQQHVMDWVTQKVYSFNSIVRALHNQKMQVEDNQRLPVFQPGKQFEQVLIVGGGPSVAQHQTAIHAFLEKYPDTCLIHASARNAHPFSECPQPQYFCLVGNEGHRLEHVLNNLQDFRGNCILPPFPRKMGTYIPEPVRAFSYELEQVDFTNQYTDSHTVLALQTAIQLGAQKIFLIGYDGYSEEAISRQEQMLIESNEYSFQQFREYTQLEPVALTPTVYKSLSAKSIYTFLI